MQHCARVFESIPAPQRELFVINARIEQRLCLTEPKPQLVRMREQLQLTAFEENVVLYLAGRNVAPSIFSSSSERVSLGGSMFRVGTLLSTFSSNFGESIKNRSRAACNKPRACCPHLTRGFNRRKVFSKNGALVKNGFLVLETEGYNTELTQCHVTVDRRQGAPACGRVVLKQVQENRPAVGA